MSFGKLLFFKDYSRKANNRDQIIKRIIKIPLQKIR
jgi:hypothetical protein